MNRVGDMLLALSDPSRQYWVNAKDVSGQVMWADGSNLQVRNFFWWNNIEPYHNIGECVYLNVMVGTFLEMENCYEEDFFPLCKI